MWNIVVDDALNHTILVDDRLEALHEALDRLEKLDERPAKVIELRSFGELAELEIAILMGVSVPTVKRE